MPHGVALTEAEQLEVLAAQTGELPPEGFSSSVVRSHFLAERGVSITPRDFLIQQEQINIDSVARTEEELPLIVSETGLFAELGGAMAFRPGGAAFDILPTRSDILGQLPGGRFDILGGEIADQFTGFLGLGQGGQENAFDIFTPAHVAVGLALALAKVPRPFAYAAIIGTEIVEIILRRMRIFPGFFTESPENVAVDILASTAGFEIGKLLPTR